MAFEIIEGFFAIEAAIHGLTGRGSELTDQFSMVRIASWTGHGFQLKHFFFAELLFRQRGCNAECF